MRLFVLTTLLAVLAMSASAQAATVHQPAPGTSVQQDGSLYFDWAWDSDEYWTPRIIFTQAADGNNPIWYGGDQPGKVRVTANYGSGWGESHATINFGSWPFTPGQWYWRLCNNTVDGEDDKCYQRGAPIPITITPKPAPPPPSPDPDSCFDEIDSDGDGKIDLDDMDDTDNADQNKWCDQVRPAPLRAATIPTLTLAATRYYIRKALKRRFGNAYRHGYAKRVSSCRRRSKTKVACRRVSWVIGDVSYRGSGSIWLTREKGQPFWNYSYKIKRTNEYCVVTGGHRCTKTYRAD